MDGSRESGRLRPTRVPTLLCTRGTLWRVDPTARLPATPTATLPAAARAMNDASNAVIIVGGGMAGLAAAHALHQAGIRAVVLEAADTIGGRVKQVRVGRGTLAEAGGEFFHGGASVSKKLADAMHLPTEQVFTAAHGDGGPDDEPAPDGSVALYTLADGQTFSWDSQDPEFLRLNESLERMREMPPVTEPDTRSVADFLRDEGVSPRMIDLAAASYANTLGVGGGLHELPLAAVVHLEQSWDDGEGDYRIRSCSTNGTAGASLSDCCAFLARGSTVHTGAAVETVEVTTRPEEGWPAVKVTCADGRRFCGLACIIATPVTVLQRGQLRFVPQLPADKVEAVRSIRMCEAWKLLLHFRAPPWTAHEAPVPRLHSLITAGTPGEVVPEIWFKDTPNGGWLASGFATGTFATALAALGEAAAADLMLQQLAKTLPGAHLATLRTHLDSVVRCDWTCTQYVGGGYSAPSFRERRHHRALYRRLEHYGRLGFCGEATEEGCMTMSAAIASGRRAAAEVLGAARASVAPSSSQGGPGDGAAARMRSRL